MRRRRDVRYAGGARGNLELVASCFKIWDREDRGRGARARACVCGCGGVGCMGLTVCCFVSRDRRAYVTYIQREESAFTTCAPDRMGTR